MSGSRSMVTNLAALVGALSVWWWWQIRRTRLAARIAAQSAVHAAVRSSDPRLRLSAVALAACLRQRQFTSEELTGLYIDMIRRVNPHLNAVVGERFDEALAEARLADVALDAAVGAQAPTAAFLGVPCVIKEVFQYPGLPYSGGIAGRRHEIGAKLCPVVRRLENAGAIVLGCGNVSEGCMWSEASNPVHGVSSMPYDLARTCGGSSGGNAAILAALGAAFSITSDVGGSTRIPSLYNGVFGHKPSGGAVPNARTIPACLGRVGRYCQIGPCTRHAEDLFPLLKIMAGPLSPGEVCDFDFEETALLQLQAPHTRTLSWPAPSCVDVKALRVLVQWQQPGAWAGVVSRRDDAMLAAQRRAVNALQDLSERPVEVVDFAGFAKAFDIWAAMLQSAGADAGAPSFAEIISEGSERGTIWPLCELLKHVFSMGHASVHTLPALGLALTEGLAKWTPRQAARFVAQGEALRDELNAALGDDGVLVFPGLPTPAPAHGPLPNLLYYADFGATAIFNTLELPVTAVPMGLSEKTKQRPLPVPVGVQIVAAHGNDHLTIAVAEALQRLRVAGWADF